MNFYEYVSVLKRKIKTKEKIMFVCIGSSDILWDCIGPLVGSYLKEKIDNYYILGDMKKNICCSNDLSKYYSRLKNKYVVAIDVAINKGLNNDIYVTNNAISMGTAFNNNKGDIGNLSIKAGLSNWKNITYSEVKNISKFIASGILSL